MKIDASNYDLYLASINQSQMQVSQQNNIIGKDKESKDSFVSSMSLSGEAIPSGTYDASGMMVGELPPVPGVNTNNDTNMDSSFLSQLSETFRANEDSILSAMESLGLALDDLSDKDNLTALANAMNEGAANLGLPTIDDLDSTVDSLYNSVPTADSASNEAAGGGSGSDEESTTTQIVTINGMTYLETTTTENGISTTTRTKIGGTEEQQL